MALGARRSVLEVREALQGHLIHEHGEVVREAAAGLGGLLGRGGEVRALAGLVGAILHRRVGGGLADDRAILELV
eukprot:7123310-Alexandrium_andersonii.AAC.1